MVNKTKLLILVVIGMLIFSACQPYRVMKVPYEGAIQDGYAYWDAQRDPNVAQQIMAEITKSANACPIYKDEKVKAIVDYYGLPSDTQVRLCDAYRNINKATLSITLITAIPATLEPTFVGETTQGAVYVGGKAVAWIFIKTAVPVAIASVLVGDIVSDAIISPISTGAVVAAGVPDTVIGKMPEKLRDLDGVPNGAIQDLERATHHTWARHTTTECIVHIVKNRPHNQVYFSAGSYKQSEPSLAFVWYLDKAIQDLTNTGNLGACSDIKSQLKQEFGNNNYVDNLGSYRIVMSVGYSLRKGFFTFSAYPVKSEIFDWQMCDWGYKWRIYPSYRQMPCGY